MFERDREVGHLLPVQLRHSRRKLRSCPRRLRRRVASTPPSRRRLKRQMPFAEREFLRLSSSSSLSSGSIGTIPSSMQSFGSRANEP
jgi:hypothetical protein